MQETMLPISILATKYADSKITYRWESVEEVWSFQEDRVEACVSIPHSPLQKSIQKIRENEVETTLPITLKELIPAWRIHFE